MDNWSHWRIGRCISSNLKEENWTVIGSARNEQNLTNFSNETGIETRPVDARNNAEMQDVANSIKDDYGKIDAVVLAVGTIFFATYSCHLNRTIHGNCRTKSTHRPQYYKFNCKNNDERKNGRIILFSSAAASIGMPNHGAISASKAGL